MKTLPQLLLLSVLLFVTGCAETQFGAHVAKQVSKDTRSQGGYKVGNPYYIMGTQYHPQESFDLSETGIASWYGPGFHGKQTANGEIYNQDDLTAAHRTLQMPSLVRVTNLDNGRSIVLRVNDRGPYSKGRVIDVSSKAADLLGFKAKGTAKVRVDVLPEESRRIAEDARMGVDTRGYEVAINSRGKLEVSPSQTAYPSEQPVTSVKVASVEREALPPVTGHVSGDGRFMPDPVVVQGPIPARTNIFIQAGSFGEQANAQRLTSQLSGYGQSQIVPATVNGKQFYRVRLGPFADVAQADQALAQVMANGSPQAKIIVE